MTGNRRITRGDQKGRALQDRLRESSLEAAASTLAAIHLSKQVRAEKKARSQESGGSGLFDADLRLPLGDVLFGVAQLQIDFTRKLFEFNRAASKRLRERLRRTPSQEVAPIRTDITEEESADLMFTIRNHAALSRAFTVELPDIQRFPVKLSLGDAPPNVLPLRLTVGANGISSVISATFAGLPRGIHEGYFQVTSHGIVVDRIPFAITVRRKRPV